MAIKSLTQLQCIFFTTSLGTTGLYFSLFGIKKTNTCRNLCVCKLKPWKQYKMWFSKQAEQLKIASFKINDTEKIMVHVTKRKWQSLVLFTTWKWWCSTMGSLSLTDLLPATMSKPKTTGKVESKLYQILKEVWSNFPESGNSAMAIGSKVIKLHTVAHDARRLSVKCIHSLTCRIPHITCVNQKERCVDRMHRTGSSH